MVQEPGLTKYLWHWLLSWTKPDQKKRNGRSYCQLTELVQDTKISEPVEMIKWFSFVKLAGINLDRELQDYLKANPKYKDMKVWLGSKQTQEVFDKYPKYVKEKTKENSGRGINQYNLVLQSNTLSFDTQTFNQKLLAYLQEKENFTLLLNSEITDIYHDSKTGVAS
jgi:hypothetical protein